MPDEVPLRKKLLPTVGRGLWYICGFILLLSLPTFSYLVPTLQGPTFDGKTSGSSGFVSRDGSPTFGTGPESSGEGFVRTKSGGFYSRSGYLGSARSTGADHSRRVRSRKMGSQSGRGLDRLSRNRADRTGSREESDGPSNEPVDSSGQPQQGEEVVNELSQMEQAYQSTLNYLFPAQSQPYGSANYDPFQSALNGQGGGGAFNDSSGDPDPADDGNSGEGEGSDDTGGGSEGDGSSGSSDPDGDGDDGQEEPRPYDFLLVGKFGGPDEAETLFRAYQDGNGSYVLEDGSEVSFFASSGVVGIPQTAVTLSDDEMLISADFNGDGTEDIVVAGWEYPVSLIRGYVRQGQLSSSPTFEAALQFVKVESIAVYDFESDGISELAVLFSGNPNLVVYKIEDDQIRYSKEMSVPFEPVVLAGTQDQGVFRQRYLQVFDESLQRSIVFSSLFPGAYSFSKPSSYQSMRSIELDPAVESGRGEQFSILRYDDVIVVVEIREDDVAFVAGFGYKEGYPKLAIGRSAEDGSRKVVFVPKGG